MMWASTLPINVVQWALDHRHIALWNPEFPESKIKRCAYSKSISCIRILFYLFLNLFYFSFCTAQRIMSQPTFCTCLQTRWSNLIKHFILQQTWKMRIQDFFSRPTLSIWCVVDALEEWWAAATRLQWNQILLYLFIGYFWCSLSSVWVIVCRWSFVVSNIWTVHGG